MATVLVRRAGEASYSPRNSALIFWVLTTNGLQQLTFPFIPDEIQRDNLAAAWEQVNRPGRRPLAYNTGQQLPVINWSLEVDNDGRSIQGLLDSLEKAADRARPVLVHLGPRQLGLVNISGLAITEKEWDARGEVTEASVDIELTQVSVAADPIGPVPRNRRRKRSTKRGRK